MVVALRNPPLTFPIQVSLPPATASAHRERVAVAWSGRATPVSQCIPFCYGILYCFRVVFEVISGATPVVPLPACVSHPGFALVRYRLSTQKVRGCRLDQVRHTGESAQTPFFVKTSCFVFCARRCPCGHDARWIVDLYRCINLLFLFFTENSLASERNGPIANKNVKYQIVEFRTPQWLRVGKSIQRGNRGSHF